MNDNKYIEKYYNEVCNTLKGDYKIILESNRDINKDFIEYDKVKWELDGDMPKFVNLLLKNKTLSFEEKILSVYKYICLNYVYDDNVLYFFKKDVSDPENIKYIAIDWYGRIVGKKWIENRKKHNRRICYEFSRYYAKALNILLDGNRDFEVFLLGLRDNTHYVTALTGKEYSLVLDLDDFNNIKDLTRLKLGLTLEGITILRDESGKFKNILDKFNENRPTELLEIKETMKIKKDGMIKYFYKVVEILKKYNLDSQGFCEYIRSVLESEGIKINKIWKKVQGKYEKRYARCLTFDFEENTYLIDSVEQMLSITSIDDLDKNIFILNPEENEYKYYGG